MVDFLRNAEGAQNEDTVLCAAVDGEDVHVDIEFHLDFTGFGLGLDPGDPLKVLVFPLLIDILDLEVPRLMVEAYSSTSRFSVI